MVERVMLCQSVPYALFINPTDQKWIKERKFDGIRALYNDGILISRTGKNITNDFKEIQIKVPKGTILDGEIVIFDTATNKDDFNLIQNHKNNGLKATYIIFDILKVANKSLIDLPLKERRKYLTHKLVKGNHFAFIYEFKVNEAEVWLQNYEGIVYKNPDSPYEFKRSSNWLKAKRFSEQTFEVDRYEITKGEKGNEGFVIYVKHDTIPNIHKVAVNDLEARKEITERFKSKHLPIKVIIQFLDVTKANSLRQPTFREIQN